MDTIFNLNNAKLITGVSSELISLSETKSHLKLNSGTFSDDVTTNQILPPASYSAGVQTGAGVDVLNKVSMININSGTNQATGEVSVVLQESDDDVTYFDWYTFTTITEANDNQIFEKQYTGNCQYIRCVATVSNADCVFSIDCLINDYLDEEDTLLSLYIKAARVFAQDYLKMGIGSQTWDMVLNKFPETDYIEWFQGPLTSVTSVKYIESDGTENTLTENTDYIVDTDTMPGKIFLPYSTDWTQYVEYPYNSVIIRGVCGYTSSTLPEIFKCAMLLHIGYMFKYRDTDIPETHINTLYSLYNQRRFSWL